VTHTFQAWGVATADGPQLHPKQALSSSVSCVNIPISCISFFIRVANSLSPKQSVRDRETPLPVDLVGSFATSTLAICPGVCYQFRWYFLLPSWESLPFPISQPTIGRHPLAGVEDRLFVESEFSNAVFVQGILFRCSAETPADECAVGHALVQMSLPTLAACLPNRHRLSLYRGPVQN